MTQFMSTLRQQQLLNMKDANLKINMESLSVNAQVRKTLTVFILLLTIKAKSKFLIWYGWLFTKKEDSVILNQARLGKPTQSLDSLCFQANTQFSIALKRRFLLELIQVTPSQKLEVVVEAEEVEVEEEAVVVTSLFLQILHQIKILIKTRHQRRLKNLKVLHQLQEQLLVQLQLCCVLSSQQLQYLLAFTCITEKRRRMRKDLEKRRRPTELLSRLTRLFKESNL